MNTFLLLCIAVIVLGIYIKFSPEDSNAQQFHNLGYQETNQFTSQPTILVSAAYTNSAVNANSNSTTGKGNVADSELDILRSINETNSEILKEMEKLADSPAVDTTRIISSYLSVVSFLVAVATFILAFFMNRELDGKLTVEMKRYWRLIALGLILPCLYMIGHGIYLIITELDSIPYLISMALTAVPVSILLHLMRKKRLR